MAFEDFVDPVTGDILLGIYRIPVDVWNAIYGFVLSAGHVPNPFSAGDLCWAFALYLGIAACESGFNMAAEGDPAADQWSGAAGTCCTYWYCLSDIVCSNDPYQTAWDRARAHATYGDYGAYLSHGVYQLYVCGQGADYACWPAYLHVMGIHMGIALPHIQNAINGYWDAGNVEMSCRICAQASGHPGWVGYYDYRVTNIWNATVNIQPDLYAFLLGDEPSPDITVTLYEHTYYGGAAKVFTSDHPDFTTIGFNDAASSIKIEGDLGVRSVRLYQHTDYGGASIAFTENHPDFNTLPMSGSLSWNDQASSLRITEPGPGPEYLPSPLPPIPEEQAMETWPLPVLPSSVGEDSPMPVLPPFVASAGWAMPLFFSPMYSDHYTLRQRFDEGDVSYKCAGSDCGYGRMQSTGKGHRGIDLTADEGRPVFPAAGSVDADAPSAWHAQVVAVEKNRQGTDAYSLGNYVILRHVPILYSNMVDTAYAHLQYGSIPDEVYPGAWVSIDTMIGRVDNTGFSVGNHLHFEVRYANATGLCGGQPCWLPGEPLTAAEFEACCKYYNPEYLVPFS